MTDLLALADEHWHNTTDPDCVCLECRTSAALREAQAEVARLRSALQRLADCDWTITLPDRMDAVRAIARAALVRET